MKAPRCPSLNPEGIWCTFPALHEGDHQGVETQYRWRNDYIDSIDCLFNGGHVWIWTANGGYCCRCGNVRTS